MKKGSSWINSAVSPTVGPEVKSRASASPFPSFGLTTGRPPSDAPFPTRLTVEEVVRNLQQIPSAPRILPRLKVLLSDNNAAPGTIVELMRLDPGIAARVLQFGNSAYFSSGLRCYSLEEAVLRVGYGEIYALVANAVAAPVLQRPLTAYGLSADELWQQAVACALAAELLAEPVGVDGKIAYTLGLLHGVGMVAIDDWASRHRPTLQLCNRGLPLETCEEEHTQLGFHHAEAGATLLNLWDFPRCMSEPVRWQYLPTGTAAHYQSAALLCAAKWVRTLALQGVAPQRPSALVLQRLGVRPAQLEKCAAQVSARLRSIIQQLPAAA